jgi:hypothetical protein
VNPQLDAGDAEDWERPAHANQSALVLDRAPVILKTLRSQDFVIPSESRGISYC